MMSILVVSIVFGLNACALQNNKSSDNRVETPNRVATEGSQDFTLAPDANGFALSSSQEITVDLSKTAIADHNPEKTESVDSAPTPSCMGPLPDDFELGVISCDDGSAPKTFFAKHALQTCIEGAVRGFKPIPAKETLKLDADCQKIKLSVHKFEPPIFVKVQ